MKYIDDIINTMIMNFDFSYMLIVNILTYIIIKVLDYFNGNRTVSTFTKRVALLFSIFIISFIYVYIGYPDIKVLINSSILAPVFWSWILRPICIKFNIGYKNIDDCLK